MRHKCENWIENGKCSKCRKPEWAVYFPEFKHDIGDKIRLPSGYTDGGKEAMIVSDDKTGYTIRMKHDDSITQWFDWWELYPVY